MATLLNQDKLMSHLIDDIVIFAEKQGREKAVELFETAVLEAKNPTLSYYFARDIEGSDILAHEQAVINSGDAEYIDKLEQYDTIKQAKQIIKRINYFSKEKTPN